MQTFTSLCLFWAKKTGLAQTAKNYKQFSAYNLKKKQWLSNFQPQFGQIVPWPLTRKPCSLAFNVKVEFFWSIHYAYFLHSNFIHIISVFFIFDPAIPFWFPPQSILIWLFWSLKIWQSFTKQYFSFWYLSHIVVLIWKGWIWFVL